MRVFAGEDTEVVGQQFVATIHRIDLPRRLEPYLGVVMNPCSNSGLGGTRSMAQTHRLQGFDPPAVGFLERMTNIIVSLGPVANRGLQPGVEQTPIHPAFEHCEHGLDHGGLGPRRKRLQPCTDIDESALISRLRLKNPTLSSVPV